MFWTTWISWECTSVSLALTILKNKYRKSISYSRFFVCLDAVLLNQNICLHLKQSRSSILAIWSCVRIDRVSLLAKCTDKTIWTHYLIKTFWPCPCRRDLLVSAVFCGCICGGGYGANCAWKHVHRFWRCGYRLCGGGQSQRRPTGYGRFLAVPLLGLPGRVLGALGFWDSRLSWGHGYWDPAWYIVMWKPCNSKSCIGLGVPGSLLAYVLRVSSISIWCWNVAWLLLPKRACERKGFGLPA